MERKSGPYKVSLVQYTRTATPASVLYPQQALEFRGMSEADARYLGMSEEWILNHEYYVKNHSRFDREYSDKFILIKHQKVLGIFDSKDEATPHMDRDVFGRQAGKQIPNRR